MSIEQIIDDFDVLDNWDDRYRYVIELGRKLATADAVGLKVDAGDEFARVGGVMHPTHLMYLSGSPGNPPGSHLHHQTRTSTANCR